jgi:dTDP-4-dehydrorhamnose reductase
MISNNPSKNLNNILILGKGYIGAELSKTLSENNNVLFKNKTELNYADQNELTKFILVNDITIVINCFGFTGRPNVDEAESKKDICWDLNVVTPLQIVNTCNKIGVKYIHISSGCIYSGYSRDFTEEDVPNFGMFDESSFYSKSKHVFETLSRYNDLKIVRIRMPICYDITNPRNYLSKIMKYPNLIDMTNSKTFIPDLCGFVNALIDSELSWNGQDIYNVVNPIPLTTHDVISLLNKGNEGAWNKLDPHWITMSELDTVAPRSNCVLDNTKASKLYNFRNETEFMWMIMNNINGIQTA